MSTPRKILLAAALAAPMAGTPALAGPLPAASSYFTKSEAIIGAPSALAAILAEQQAPARAAPLQPSASGLARAPYQVQTAAIRTADLAAAGRSLLSPAVLSGKPDIFGTVALKVGHTPLDGRWQKASRAGVGGAAGAYASSLRGAAEKTRLDAINRYVNRRVRFVDDERQFGRADVWSTANSTLSRGRGDCEDYAIAKIEMLRSAGISARDVYLVVLKDLVRRADHAVAVVRSGDHMYVLDNGTDELLDSETVRDYHPILTFSAYGTWTHGYRVAPPMTIASTGPKPIAAAISAAAGDAQRSRSASLLAFNTGLSR
ncbi:MAG TPA: transglutaminase-like cysteine peptidase [Sphingomicrobium sp.]|nr:transglutaminase-like cysteine peptidase [Sphingomicrobium sp.]